MLRTDQFKSVICMIAFSFLLASCLPSSPIPSPAATPSPPPAASPTLPPLTTPPPDHAPAMRPEFAADLELFPNGTRYEIELTVDLDAPAVTGHERANYTNTTDTPLDTLYLRLFPNTPGYGGDMTVTNIKLNDRPVEPARELGDSALRLPLDPPLEPGATIVLTLDFTTALPTSTGEGYRQLGYYDAVVALANVYPIIPAYDDQAAGPELVEGWNIEIAPTYGDAIYSETAFYTVQVTAPAGMTLAASGACAPSALNPDDGNATWNCVTGPMRDFNAILGPDYRVESDLVAGITVNSLFYSNHQEGGALALDWASEAVRVFSDRFGQYPFSELDIVETPTYAGGIEYPGLVVINSGYYETLSQDMEWVVVHEVAHQWWYSLVGNDQVDDPWLDEALTQYSTLLYYEDRYGTALAANLVDEVFWQPYDGLVQSGRDAPAGMPVAAYSEADYGAVVYRKGPLYFHELRQAVGEESFGAILQTYFERNRYGVARPEDWLAAVKEIVGDEHRSLYEQWIAGTTEQ